MYCRYDKFRGITCRVYPSQTYPVRRQYQYLRVHHGTSRKRSPNLPRVTQYPVPHTAVQHAMPVEYVPGLSQEYAMPDVLLLLYWYSAL